MIYRADYRCERLEGKLKVASAIRTDKIYTLSKDIVRKKFGQVNTEVLEDVHKRIIELIE
ncbi:type II toxin-antitoxin system PemK/MazF family toxin [Gracilibacillus massiliensis]|uniref:type II toxin-antitoxin system PemK/MazF family toxin n=1 Tax=Gracilibacillus massiliensis TaxID=1564956 RepID=UPI00071DABB3